MHGPVSFAPFTAGAGLIPPVAKQEKLDDLNGNEGSNWGFGEKNGVGKTQRDLNLNIV